MISHKNAYLVAASVLMMSSAEIALAQQKIEEAGRDFMIRDNQVSEVEEGHVVVLISEKGITMTDDPSHPLNMTTVDCTGIFEEFPDGKYKGNGYCTNKDRDGDQVVARWTASSDAAAARYEVVSGTGKFEGATGEGTPTETEVSPGPQGRYVVRWEGTAEYPNIQK